MKRLYPFDPYIKHHILISLLLAIWIFVFLYFTEPLDVNEFGDREKLIYLPGYGLVGGVCYLLFLPIQYYIYRRSNLNWTIISELLFLLIFCIGSITIARIYYLKVVMIGESNPYSLIYMLKAIYLPAIATILPIVIVGRFAFGKYYEKRIEDLKIEIKGEGNYEGLKLHLNDVICIQSADNYVEVFYISGHSMKKTLIRNKLSVIDNEFPELLRTHRSYLVNPHHFIQWKTDNGKLFMELSYDNLIPISKTYQADIRASINSATN